MDVSSISTSLQNAQTLQALSSYLVPNSQSSDTSAADLFSAALQQNQSALTSQNSSNDNYLEMLQALETSNSATTTNPFLQAPDGTNSTDPTDSYLSMLDNATMDDPLLQAAGSTTNDATMLQSLEGADSSSSIADSLLGSSDSSDPFDSNFAIIEALQSSGMSGQQMNQVLSNLQLGTQYNQAGNLSSGSSDIPNLFSATA